MQNTYERCLLIRQGLQPLGFLSHRLTRALEDYRSEDLLIVEDPDELERGTVYLDQLALSILKAIGAFYKSSSAKWGAMKTILKIVLPLFTDSPGAALFPYALAESTPLPEDGPAAVLRKNYRNLVYREALGLVNNALTHPELEPYFQAFSDQTTTTNSTRWREFFERIEVLTLARYMKMLLARPLVPTDVLSGIGRLAPILCGVSRDRTNQMGIEAEMEQFRTAWAALQDSGRFPMAPEPERPGVITFPMPVTPGSSQDEHWTT